MKRSVVMVAAAVAGLLTGCGSDSTKPPLHQLALQVRADWDFFPKSLDEVGFTYDVTLSQFAKSSGGNVTCDKIPESLTVSGLGQMLPLNLDADGCVYTHVTIGPTLQPSTVVFTAEMDGKMIGQATFDGLTPGAMAALVSPAGGMVHAGDEIVIGPPPALPSSSTSAGVLFPLEQMPWPGTQTIASERLADGIHVVMPAFTGRAALAFIGSPFNPDAIVTCDGFAVCNSAPSFALGPVFVTEGM